MYAGINFIGQLLDFLGQFLNLNGHHGEAFAFFTGAGGLNGGVKRQNVGFIRNRNNFAHTLLNTGHC